MIFNQCYLFAVTQITRFVIVLKITTGKMFMTYRTRFWFLTSEQIFMLMVPYFYQPEWIVYLVKWQDSICFHAAAYHSQFRHFVWSETNNQPINFLLGRIKLDAAQTGYWIWLFTVVRDCTLVSYVTKQVLFCQKILDNKNNQPKRQVAIFFESIKTCQYMIYFTFIIF